mmetsp:Transcript_17169/g.41317  ORF Transcript_17169/g.41317 Transcript_17169/m.41317 type:complete len:392 (-) Transcript_17169:413-1588(-)
MAEVAKITVAQPNAAAPGKEPSAAQSPHPAWFVPWAVMGFLEGFVFQKVAVVYPAILADQFVFRNWVVMKFFLSAVGFSMLSQAIFATVAPELMASSMDYGKTVYGSPRVVLGCTLLGAGMAVAGSGPSMFVPAAGASVGNSGWLFLGGFLAALGVGIADLFTPVTGKGRESMDLSLPAVIKSKAHKDVRYGGVAVVMGMGLVAATVVLEVVVPYKEDLERYGGAFALEYPDNPLEHPAWPPIVVGLTVGLAQIPVRLISGDGLGTATSFTIAVATLSWGKLSPGKGLQESRKNWWQPLFILFILVGAVVAGVLGPELVGAEDDGRLLEEGFKAWVTGVGGFLCILGARIAGGCTCGHGVSGTSELSLESFVGAGAIFGAAIVTRCVIEYA